MSVFNCAITYRKVDGDALTSTYNRLRSQGFIDQYNNIIDVAKFYSANNELSELASARLGTEVRLYTTPMRPNGRVAVPNMKAFGMLDQLVKNRNTENLTPKTNDDITLSEQNDNSWNPPSRDAINRIYTSIGKQVGAVITQDQVEGVEAQIKEFNAQSDRQELALVETNRVGEYLINTGYKSNYLFTASDFKSTPEDKKVFIPKSDNSDFNKNCII